MQGTLRWRLGALGGCPRWVSSVGASMPGLQGATLVELPRKLQRSLLTRRELQARPADISESVVHTAVMGLLLVTGEVMPAPPGHRGDPGDGRERGDRARLTACRSLSPQTHHTLLLGSGHVGLRNLGNTVSGLWVP